MADNVELTRRPFGEAVRYLLHLPPDTSDADTVATLALLAYERHAPTATPSPAGTDTLPVVADAASCWGGRRTGVACPLRRTREQCTCTDVAPR